MKIEFDTRPICICVPCQDQVQTGFAFDLSALVGNWAANHPQKPVHLVAIKGSILPGQRQRIAVAAMKAKSSHMLWLDTDMRFPPDTLDCLLAHDEDFVACNYTTRRGGCRPVSVKANGKELMFTGKDSRGLEEAMVAGFGCALIRTEVFEKLSLPYFCTTWSPEDGKYTGEDVYFCFKYHAELGVFPKIDHTLSGRIRHTGVFDYHHGHVDPKKIDDEGENF